MNAGQQGVSSEPRRHPTGVVPPEAYDPLKDSRQRLTSYAVLAAPCVVALLVSFLVTPDDIESGRVVLSTPCLTRTLLGVPCPSCGMTRAFTALSHGDFARAWDYNALSPGMYVLVWLVGVWASVGALRMWKRLRRVQRGGDG